MAADALAKRALVVDREELLDVAGVATGAGGSLWIHVRGGSMLPAIPRGAEVRVVPVPPRGVGRGDVVLARGAGGQPLVHRVWLALGDRVWLKGDFRVTPDRAVSRRAIAGIVDAVRVGDRTAPISRRPSRAPRDVVRRWRALARELLAGA